MPWNHQQTAALHSHANASYSQIIQSTHQHTVGQNRYIYSESVKGGQFGLVLHFLLALSRRSEVMLLTNDQFGLEWLHCLDWKKAFLNLCSSSSSRRIRSLNFDYSTISGQIWFAKRSWYYIDSCRLAKVLHMFSRLFQKPSSSSASLSVLKWINILGVIFLFSISFSSPTICCCQTLTAVALQAPAEEHHLTVLGCKAKQHFYYFFFTYRSILSFFAYSVIKVL